MGSGVFNAVWPLATVRGVRTVSIRPTVIQLCAVGLRTAQHEKPSFSCAQSDCAQLNMKNRHSAVRSRTAHSLGTCARCPSTKYTLSAVQLRTKCTMYVVGGILGTCARCPSPSKSSLQSRASHWMPPKKSSARMIYPANDDSRESGPGDLEKT